MNLGQATLEELMDVRPCDATFSGVFWDLLDVMVSDLRYGGALGGADYRVFTQRSGHADAASTETAPLCISTLRSSQAPVCLS